MDNSLYSSPGPKSSDAPPSPFAGEGTFFEYSRAEISQIVGGSASASQLFRAVYQKQDTNAAPFNLNLPTVIRSFQSEDGTQRFLLRLEDGEMIESVIIPGEDRLTFCVSSQVGCALACTFCLTGLLGLKRNLTTGEIVSQVVLLARTGVSSRFSVVLMGMGEPLQNYDNVIKAISILNDDHGYDLSSRRITLSTAGLVPGLERLAREPLFPNLSISLTGASNSVRDRLMPINRKYPIEDVLAVVRTLPPQRQKRVMLEYVMIKGVTDSPVDAQALADLIGTMRVKVNLIPFNPAPELDFTRSDDDDILRFHAYLLGKGIATFVRKSRGGDVSGACGQLMKKTLQGT
jgi:23S rRNA (adenine2503-C2)-methyltransferase